MIKTKMSYDEKAIIINEWQNRKIEEAKEMSPPTGDSNHDNRGWLAYLTGCNKVMMASYIPDEVINKMKNE